MKGRLINLRRLYDGAFEITLSTKEDVSELYDKLSTVPVQFEIKKDNPKRSKTANDFCWALCTDIGNAIIPPVPKEIVYRRAIRDVGEYEPLPIKEEAVETFQRRWQSKGIGWFAEVIDDSKIPGYKLVFAYYGSSTYDTASMARLLDYLVQDAMNMGLKIPTSKEQEEMLNAWSLR